MFMRYGKDENLHRGNIETTNKVDLNDLMKKVRNEEKRSKRTSVYLSAAAISAFGLIYLNWF